jgi:3-phosphoshikimate 1-carboxyvinyltransferase
MELRLEGGAPLVGELVVPADKSVTHRALMLSALADGESTVTALAPGEDNHSTARVMRSLGATVTQTASGFAVRGVGLSGLRSPGAPLDCGNSGTTMRLVTGLLAGAGVEAELFGDASLSRRPMGRVCKPLRALGGSAAGRPDGARELPPVHTGPGAFRGGEVTLDIASAQVKSALLLAGLGAGKAVTVREPSLSRDHSERMLRALGVPLVTHAEPTGAAVVELGAGVRALPARAWQVPGDFSSAAFFLSAAVMVPGSRVALADVGVNPTRTGLLEVLLELGARIAVAHRRDEGGEPTATLVAESSSLAAPGAGPFVVGGPLVPRLIDELVVLAAVASQVRGTVEVKDAAELRVKESDRVRETVRLLEAFGVAAEERAEGYVVRGAQRLHGARVDVGADHRLALTAAVLALAAPGESVLEGFDVAAVSYPGLPAALESLGAKVRVSA